MNDSDILILGAGQGGSALAGRLAKRGERVTLIERERLGGSCVNYGCTPSKAMLAAAHSITSARRAATTLGVDVNIRPDFGRAMQRVREIRDEWRRGVDSLEEMDGVNVVYAEAKFIDGQTVEASGKRYRAPRIIINTGTRARVPEVSGLENTPFLTNKTIFDLTELPPRTIVVGGGYVGLELGQSLASFGSAVTIIHRDDHLLTREPDRVGKTLQESLQAAENISIRLNAETVRVRFANHGFTVFLKDGSELEAEALLVAVGRTPNTDMLNLDAAGIETDDRGHVEINDQFETAADGVYAIGDCAGQPAFTHVSYEDHRRLLAIWNGEDRTRDDRVLAYSVFTDPQVGHVGLSVEQAKVAGHDVIERSQDFGEVARGKEWGQSTGYMQIIADRKTEKLLGAVFVGYEAGELAQLFLPLIEKGHTWRIFDECVFAHPTYGEAIQTLARRFHEDE